MCQLTSLWAPASVVGFPSPSRVPSGPERRVDGVGRGSLLAAELEQVAAGDHQAVLVAELVDEAEQSLAVLRRHGRRLGGWGRIPRAEPIRHPQLELMAAACGTNAIAGLVGDDAQQPGPWLSSRAEGRQCPIRLHETLLCRVLASTPRPPHP